MHIAKTMQNVITRLAKTQTSRGEQVSNKHSPQDQRSSSVDGYFLHFVEKVVQG